MGFRRWLSERRRREQERLAAKRRLIEADIAAHPNESAHVIEASYSDVPIIAMCACKVRLEEFERQRREARLRTIIREELEASNRGLR